MCLICIRRLDPTKRSLNWGEGEKRGLRTPLFREEASGFSFSSQAIDSREPLWDSFQTFSACLKDLGGIKTVLLLADTGSNISSISVRNYSAWYYIKDQAAPLNSNYEKWKPGPHLLKTQNPDPASEQLLAFREEAFGAHHCNDSALRHKSALSPPPCDVDQISKHWNPCCPKHILRL